MNIANTRSLSRFWWAHHQNPDRWRGVTENWRTAVDLLLTICMFSIGVLLPHIIFLSHIVKRIVYVFGSFKYASCHELDLPPVHPNIT
ncbi:MAG: hypothetical protein ACRYGR_09460, partial [Janthinobacterium lividum]